MWWRDFDDNNQSFWREVSRLRRQLNRLSDDSFRLQAPGFPALNVWSTAENVMVTAEVPGIEPGELDISVVGKTLTLSGLRQAEEVGEETRDHRRERGHGRFSRTLHLPYRIDPEKVEASFSKGVLQMQLPRAEADKPRKITVKSA